ncbi:uncharacterized protein HKW66_Vig0230570 [Vigna angularis]|uniref:SAWADEE domain-containing protein n=2 Tax=Phaseolus angularis TaxID=3914 RepID=A0A8T0KD37_PHAAN|nr:uncharacterized protein HKW66_Vig0230570 [Vigna angularis]BAT89600.1 hypothetical protein VIGAN_06059200 [Vigna angularis var. angularis]
MAKENDYTMEFRSYRDDAWYTARVSFEGGMLRVWCFDFPGECYDAFEASQFGECEHLHDFQHRFRPLSKQLQDSECGSVVTGTRVCACQRFGDGDIRFYDAVVDGVKRRKHSLTAKEKSCVCTFILFWLNGPKEGNLTATTIEDICIIQSEGELDPVLVSFLEMAKGKIDLFSTRSVSASKGVSSMEMAAEGDRGSGTTYGIGYFERIEKEKRHAKPSVAKVFSPEVTCDDMKDRDLEGTKNVCMILIANIDGELCPSTVTQFLQRHTLVSARVLFFPNLSSDVYTRGAIILDSEKELQKMCGFLNDPNCIITSSTGRPWVILEKLVGLKEIKSSIGTFGHTSESISRKGKSGTSTDLKVLCPGTQEFKRASDMRNLLFEFISHQERLHKRLALEERRIFADEQPTCSD